MLRTELFVTQRSPRRRPRRRRPPRPYAAPAPPPPRAASFAIVRSSRSSSTGSWSEAGGESGVLLPHRPPERLAAAVRHHHVAEGGVEARGLEGRERLLQRRPRPDALRDELERKRRAHLSPGPRRDASQGAAACPDIGPRCAPIERPSSEGGPHARTGSVTSAHAVRGWSAAFRAEVAADGAIDAGRPGWHAARNWSRSERKRGGRP